MNELDNAIIATVIGIFGTLSGIAYDLRKRLRETQADFDVIQGLLHTERESHQITKNEKLVIETQNQLHLQTIAKQHEQIIAFEAQQQLTMEQLNRVYERVGKLEFEQEKLIPQIEVMQKQITTLIAENKELAIQREKLAKQRDKAIKERDQLKYDYDNIKQDMDNLIEINKGLSSQITALNEQIQHYKQSMTDSQLRIEELESRFPLQNDNSKGDTTNDNSAP